MKKSFTLGAIAGITSFAIAIPILAQVSSAANTSSASSSDNAFYERGMHRQPDLQTMIDRDTAFLANVDAMIASLKTATQTRLNALNAAKALTDEAAQRDAVKKANDDFHSAMQASMTAHPEWKGAMPFGGPMGPGKHMGMMGRHSRGPGPDALAEKLGMTADELKAALDSGKTIQDIAKEKGIDLPAPPMWKMRGEDDTSSAQ